jgi:hypothetical protein
MLVCVRERLSNWTTRRGTPSAQVGWREEDKDKGVEAGPLGMHCLCIDITKGEPSQTEIHGFEPHLPPNVEISQYRC